MKILALTGGIASGKSTVANFFTKQGAIVLDADKTAHEVYKKKSPVYQKIKARYGKKILKKDQSIDRKKLADILFHSPQQKKWLEKQIHPATIKLLGEKLQKALQKKPKLILVEAALHVETGYYRQFDGMIVISVPTQTQLERLILRDKISKAEAKQRLKNQIPLIKKRRLANWVIDNSGNRNKTEQQVIKFLKNWKSENKNEPHQS